MKVVQIYHSFQDTHKHVYPLFDSPVSAGFPSPADDYIEQDIDLHDYLVKNPPATFLVRAEGDSMEGAGIFSGDILIVDKSLSPQDGNVVIAVVDGDLTVKRLLKSKKGITLSPENEHYQPIHISDEQDITIWGVVTNVIHSLK
ncbi:MAG: peptidase S24 [Candidatus Magasanikbacteria bacterium CG10_big_fil_rev_8_21_14_0_10_42_10]|uniref:Peptidase S24 n=2 Tax=Candidatus Magasanikiibacteriota TaxID=1752731 RepID=A0A2H0TX35_9BACT|nr:MAG: peptidase S24 [Candidatus Magasanikbacteria bacterium CG10_big_fil_rev_8_21_14_0_10_42_10]PIZ94753.1 MAG: peptidase S24 [Candidatus Magasanikbacteria bacterium CG_4_10_14_0_2_um_filter_41_10]